MPFYKKFTFWIPLMSLGICVYNSLGYDDKNLLLFFISPPFWVIELRGFINNDFLNSLNISIELVYIITIFFWFIVGLILDKTRKK